VFAIKLTKRETKVQFILTVILLGMVLSSAFMGIDYTSAHSTVAYPTEIFSIWNGTNPIIDGEIDFSYDNTSLEWDFAAIYNLYNGSNSINGKLFLQNSNSELYIGLDGLVFQDSSPATSWGVAIYFDIDHNGFLTTKDRALRFISNSSGTFVEFLGYNNVANTWTAIEWGSAGSTMPLTGILVDTDFTTSNFDTNNDHRQYEMKIPFSTISSNPGKNMGIGFELFEDFTDQTSGITWPYVESDLHKIRTNMGVLGDVTFGEENKDSFDYIIEKNLNVNPSATGYNNGSFIASGDIDGNGDYELIVSSNRTVLGDDNLLSIYDFVSGEYQRIWSSWETSHQVLLTFPIQRIVAHDFNQDGEEEIFVVGNAPQIIRFSEWNTTADNFDVGEVIFTHTYELLGYLVAGDTNNDTVADLTFGDSSGYINVLEYNNGTDTFTHDEKSPSRTKINGVYPYRIHAVGVGDMDDDLQNEILIQYQTSADDTLSETQLIIFHHTNKLVDNPEDDLPLDSSSTTADYFGHTAFVADVDNDGVNETIIVGKDYIKIFENDTFTDPSPPLEIALNDGVSLPNMAGGAIVADLNNDGLNELIFGANNGTLYIGTVTDIGTALDFNLEWSRDLGSCLGYRGALVVEDFDQDGENELAIGDNFGQIFIIGKGNVPQLLITSPSNNYVSSQDNVLVKWTALDDHYAIHYVEVYVEGLLVNKVGGAQNCSVVSLAPAQNLIEIVAFDFSGRNTTKSITVKFDVKAPQVTITSPSSYFITNQDEVEITYFNTDPDDDFDYYKIYRNGSIITESTELETFTVPLFASGVWNITVIAVDETLLEGRESIIVIRDSQAPIITIDSPNDGDAIKVTGQEIVWSASDALSSMDYYEVFVDGFFYNTTTSKSMTVSLGMDKTYTIEVIAYDIMGNFASDDISIILDTVSPTVAFDPILLPTRDDGYYYTNNPLLSLSWNATDNELGSGISQTSITINGFLYDSYPPATISDIIDLGNDSYSEIFITAYDKAGNVAEDYIGVILDRAAPSVLINNPANNITTGLDYVIVSWNSFDAGVGIKEHIILVDGVLEAVITDLEISFYQVDLPLNKTYLITVRAIDILDYSFDYSINVTHDPNAPTISISVPTSKTSYINENTTTIDWVISGLLVDHFEIYINGTLFNTYSNTTYSALITLNPQAYELPIFNVTIYAITQSALIYTDFRWIIIDQAAPAVGFNNPPIVHLVENMQVEWFGIDDGSGLDYYEIIFGVESVLKDSVIHSHVFNVTGLNGQYSLTVIAYDISGNSAFETVIVTISLYSPIFETTLEPLVICNDLNMQFNLSLTDTGLGISTISIVADNTNSIFSESYGASYQTEPFSILINVTANHFLVSLDHHNISISVKDELNRETREVILIILDQEDPYFWRDPIFDSNILHNDGNEITLEDGQNSHSITIYIFEDHDLENVTVTLTGQGYNETFLMIYNPASSTATVKVYEITLDFSELEVGDYTLTFNFVDEAGNSNSEIYILSLIRIPRTSFPFIYLIIGLAIVIIASLVLVITLRRPTSNRGWEEEIVVVAYVLKSGLTSLFIPYSVEIATDEQLFGGAMSGIRGILEEIIGKKNLFEVETVEFGDKHLLIYSGLHGDTVLLVRSIKPIHSKLLSKFADDFEKEYSEPLSDDRHVSLSDYIGAEILVEEYFGKRAPIDAAAYEIARIEPEEYRRRITEQPAETGKDALLSTFYQEILGNHEAFNQLTESAKVLIGDAITFAEESLTDLISEEFKNAENKANNALKSLTRAKQSIKSIEHFKEIFNTIPKIVELVLHGAVHGQKGNIEDYHRAIELASQLFLAQIT